MLSDREIMRAIENKELYISHFDTDSLTPNGYDLKVGEIMVPDIEKHVQIQKVIIPRMTHFLIGTLEEVSLDSRHTAQLWIKSKWARRGVLASFGLVDAGFRGILTIGAFSTREIQVKLGDKFVQICFFRMSKPAESDYAKRSGHYQNQKNIKI